MKQKKTSNGVGLTLQIDAKTNDLLTEAAIKSNRTKRSESTLRLKDHLMRFETISQIGEVQEKPIK